MRIPAHIIKDNQRRKEERRKRHDEAARIPLERPTLPKGPKGHNNTSRGEKKRAVVIVIEF